MLETIFSPSMLQTLLGGICTLFVTALFYAAKLKREDKCKFNQIIAELLLTVDELSHNIAVISELRQKAPEIIDSCRSNGPVKQIFFSVRSDLIASSRVLLAKLGCEMGTISIVTQALTEVSTMQEAVTQAKALIAIPHIEQSATLYAVSRIQELIDRPAPGVIERLKRLKTEIEGHIESYKLKLTHFESEHPLVSYMWQFE